MAIQSSPLVADPSFGQECGRGHHNRPNHALRTRRDEATVHPHNHGDQGKTYEADNPARYIHHKRIDLRPLMGSTAMKEDQCPQNEGDHCSYRQYSMGGETHIQYEQNEC